MQEQITRYKALFGKAYTVGTDHLNNIFGWSIPDLSFQYLLASDMFWMSKIYEIAGPPESLKSLFLLSLMANFMRRGGIGFLVDTENGKTSPHLIEALMEGCLHNLSSVKAGDHESMQAYVTGFIAYHKKLCLQKGYKIPLVVGIDSLVGVKSQENSAKFEKDGHSGKRFPIEAMMNTHLFSELNKQIIDWPIVIIATNHLTDDLKKQETQPSYMSKHATMTKGGVTFKFFCATRLELNVTQRKELVSGTSSMLHIKSVKNALSIHGRRLSVKFSTKQSEEENKVKVHFDWNRATADLFKSDAFNNQTVKDLLKVKKSDNTGVYSSKVLGLEGVDADTFCEGLYQRPDIVEKIKPAVQIMKFRKVSEKDLIIQEGEKKEEDKAATERLLAQYREASKKAEEKRKPKGEIDNEEDIKENPNES